MCDSTSGEVLIVDFKYLEGFQKNEVNLRRVVLARHTGEGIHPHCDNQKRESFIALVNWCL